MMMSVFLFSPQRFVFFFLFLSIFGRHEKPRHSKQCLDGRLFFVVVAVVVVFLTIGATTFTTRSEGSAWRRSVQTTWRRNRKERQEQKTAVSAPESCNQYALPFYDFSFSSSFSSSSSSATTTNEVLHFPPLSTQLLQQLWQRFVRCCCFDKCHSCCHYTETNTYDCCHCCYFNFYSFSSNFECSCY